jgi:hypothetical protein
MYFMMIHLYVKYVCAIEFIVGMDSFYIMHYQVKMCVIEFTIISKNGFMQRNVSYRQDLLQNTILEHYQGLECVSHHMAQ